LAAGRAGAPPIWQWRYNGVVNVVAKLRWMRRWETIVFAAAPVMAASGNQVRTNLRASGIDACDPQPRSL
jgi:hypothetical protein